MWKWSTHQDGELILVGQQSGQRCAPGLGAISAGRRSGRSGRGRGARSGRRGRGGQGRTRSAASAGRQQPGLVIDHPAPGLARIDHVGLEERRLREFSDDDARQTGDVDERRAQRDGQRRQGNAADATQEEHDAHDAC